MNKFKPISISLSPNVQKDDLRLALNLLIRPWFWTKGKQIAQLEEEFKKYLGVKYAVSFNSGRSSLYAILKALDLPGQSEILLQAFTCNAVPNPVLWADLRPVYVDCNKDDYNIDTEDLRKKITARSRAVIIQHTFGMPADMDQIRTVLAENSNLILIEDCAHALGAEYNGEKVGVRSKAAFFSFSRDKIISSVYGGMAVTNDDELGRKLQDLQKQFGQPPAFWTIQQILHPILLSYVILPIYRFFDLGKIILVLSQVLHILSKAVSWKEKRGLRPDYFPKALPNALAAMALNQFSKLDDYNKKRRKVADFYYEKIAAFAKASAGQAKFILPKKFENRKSAFLRFAVRHKDAHLIIHDAWDNENILLGDWYTTCIAPHDTRLEDVKYAPGSCPNAEDLAKKTLNLPTHITLLHEDAERVVKFLSKYK